MKKHVQHAGVRKWFGDDWIGIQDELYKAIEKGLLNGGNGIVSGMNRTYDPGTSNYTFSEGIVMLDGSLYSVDEYTTSAPTIYLTPTTASIDRPYLQGGSNEIAIVYTATIVELAPLSGTYIIVDGSKKSRYFLLKTDENGLLTANSVALLNEAVNVHQYITDYFTNNFDTWNYDNSIFKLNNFTLLQMKNQITSFNLNVAKRDFYQVNCGTPIGSSNGISTFGTLNSMIGSCVRIMFYNIAVPITDVYLRLGDGAYGPPILIPGESGNYNIEPDVIYEFIRNNTSWTLVGKY